MNKPDNEYYTPLEVAEKFNVSLKFVQKHIATRRLPGLLKVGRHWRIKKSELQKQILSGSLLLG